MLLPLLVLLAAPAATSSQADVEARLSKWKQVPMADGTAGLSAAQKAVVSKLVDASRFIESIYWRRAIWRRCDF